MQKTNLHYFNDNLLKLMKYKTLQIFNIQNMIIGTMVDFVEFRNNIASQHVNRTQKYLKALVQQLIDDDVYADELLAWDINIILQSSQLHDLGKIAISDTILNKPGKLTPEEFAIMKTHAQQGVEAIEKMKRSADLTAFLAHSKFFAGTHHEKWDGSGYPRGLKGEGIPLEGRLMAIVDVYDALTSDRPYKKAFTADESARIIIENAGTHFDPALIKTFRKLEGDFADIAMKYPSSPHGNHAMN